MKKKIRKNKLDLTKISGTACYILVAFYETQLTNIEYFEDLQIGFKSTLFAGKRINDEQYNKFEFANKLLSITNNISILISAFRYLKDKDLVRFDEQRTSNDRYSFYNFHLTDKGIDIIESSKDNPLIDTNLAKTFNLNLSPKFNFDSLVKANNIVGVGGAASADLNMKTK